MGLKAEEKPFRSASTPASDWLPEARKLAAAPLAAADAACCCAGAAGKPSAQCRPASGDCGSATGTKPAGARGRGQARCAGAPRPGRLPAIACCCMAKMALPQKASGEVGELGQLQGRRGGGGGGGRSAGLADNGRRRRQRACQPGRAPPAAASALLGPPHLWCGRGGWEAWQCESASSESEVSLERAECWCRSRMDRGPPDSGRRGCWRCGEGHAASAPRFTLMAASLGDLRALQGEGQR